MTLMKFHAENGMSQIVDLEFKEKENVKINVTVYT